MEDNRGKCANTDIVHIDLSQCDCDVLYREQNFDGCEKIELIFLNVILWICFRLIVKIYS